MTKLETVAPVVFEPPWVARLNGQIINGRGLLPKLLHHRRDAIESFTVFSVSVYPTKGEVWVRGYPCYRGAPDNLMWFRRMEATCTEGAAIKPPGCLWYGVGLWLHGSPAWACRVFQDGRIQPGL